MELKPGDTVELPGPVDWRAVVMLLRRGYWVKVRTE